jgi:LysR family transcriptional activator of nhaA
MEWTNYHHLLYFWMVCREGTVARAAAKLGLAQQTVGAQIRQLESALEERLLDRVGRRLRPTEAGRVVQSYADEIFSLGREMREALRGHALGRSPRLAVGIVDALPKMIAVRLLQPALRTGVHLVVREARAEELLSRLAVHELDLVLTDAPLPPNVTVRAFQHVLGESNITVFGAARIV